MVPMAPSSTSIFLSSMLVSVSFIIPGYVHKNKNLNIRILSPNFLGTRKEDAQDPVSFGFIR